MMRESIPAQRQLLHTDAGAGGGRDLKAIINQGEKERKVEIEG
jgi:hypothetical protein